LQPTNDRESILEQETSYTEIFKQSSFWQNKRKFYLRDIRKICNCNNLEAKVVARELMAREIDRNQYQQGTTHPMAHKKWREPLEWDGLHTPKYC
tara:strand:- start:3413 stop:3697 length:285 start_codon:yes stop_codon:yes gene_type:complete